jgi:hypothetical protein
MHQINIVKAFALLCVTVTSIYVMYMGWSLLKVLSGPGWCATAIGANRVTDSRIDIAQSCVSLLTIQLKSLAINSYIFGGVTALCLATLIVIVIAGGHVNFDAGPTSVKVDISTNKENSNASSNNP